MNVVIELDSYSLKYENVLSIGRGFVAAGTQVQMWDSRVTAFLDMVNDVKPDIVFYHSEVNPRLIQNLPNIRMVQTDVFAAAIVADTVSFKPMAPNSLFQNSEVCLLQYPEVENSEDAVLKLRMSGKNTAPFRLFSIRSVSGASYCGWIPKELHPLAFSSATSVLALSKNTAINALLCNPKVKLSTNGVESDFTMSTDEIQSLSNLEIANGYLRG